jgi:uncharacterized membrane protein (GlpM family)
MPNRGYPQRPDGGADDGAGPGEGSNRSPSAAADGESGSPQPGDPRGSIELSPPARVVVLMAAVAYAAYLSGTEPFTWQADVTVAIPIGLVAAGTVISWRAWERTRIEPVSAASWLPWAVIGTVAVAWELFNYLTLPRSAHQTLSSLGDHAMSYRPAKAGFVLVWLVAGWALVRGWRRWCR